MGYKVEMECPQTEVGEHSEVGYRSGDRLPVGHKDVGPDWRPIVVEVEDSKPAEDKPAAEKPQETPPPSSHATRQAGANK